MQTVHPGRAQGAPIPSTAAVSDSLLSLTAAHASAYRAAIGGQSQSVKRDDGQNSAPQIPTATLGRSQINPKTPSVEQLESVLRDMPTWAIRQMRGDSEDMARHHQSLAAKLGRLIKARNRAQRAAEIH